MNTRFRTLTVSVVNFPMSETPGIGRFSTTCLIVIAGCDLHMSSSLERALLWSRGEQWPCDDCTEVPRGASSHGNTCYLHWGL